MPEAAFQSAMNMLTDEPSEVVVSASDGAPVPDPFADDPTVTPRHTSTEAAHEYVPTVRATVTVTDRAESATAVHR